MSSAFDSVAKNFDGAPLDSAPKIHARPTSIFNDVVRIRPVGRPTLTFAANDIGGQVYTFGKLETTEIELSLPSHVLLMFPDGISGGCEWLNNHESGRLSVVLPNTVIFNPAKEYFLLCKKRSQTESRLLLLTIPPTVLSRINGQDDESIDIHFSQQIGMNDAMISQTLVAVLQEVESPGLNSRSYVDSLLMLLLNRLIRCASNLATPLIKPKNAKGGLAPWRLKQTLRLLENESTKAPSLAEVAETIKLHPTYLCRAFKQSTGITPHRYSLVHHINQAKKMMEDPNFTLTQIALNCGFSSSSQFSAAFKRVVGVSPRAFRRTL